MKYGRHWVLKIAKRRLTSRCPAGAATSTLYRTGDSDIRSDSAEVKAFRSVMVAGTRHRIGVALRQRHSISRRADAVAAELAVSAKLLDIGGGSGVYACALAANTSALEAVVLEQAPVDAIARELIAKRGLADRVTVATGDMFNDPWPTDCDLHLFSNVMHDWDVPEILALLRRSHDALVPGGRVLIHEAFLDADKKGPLPVAEYSCILAHSTRGRCYSVAEMGDCLERTGFRFLEHRQTGGDRSVILAERI